MDKTKIGNRVVIHAGTVIGGDGFGYVWDKNHHRKVPQIGNVVIEDDVMISAGSIIFAHDASSPKQAVSRVLIKKSVYLGVGSIVLPGVTIGEGAVVGAGAVVTRDVQPHTVVVGVPAKPIQRNKEPRLYQPGR